MTVGVCEKACTTYFYESTDYRKKIAYYNLILVDGYYFNLVEFVVKNKKFITDLKNYSKFLKQKIYLKPKQRWLLLGSLGTLCLGTGISLAIEASHWKNQDQEFYIWFIGGTAGIALIFIGIVSLIRAGHIENKFRNNKK